jgi:hypothetical protein
MNKWTVRVIGILMLLAFAIVFASMHNKLRRIQRQQQESAVPR